MGTLHPHPRQPARQDLPLEPRGLDDEEEEEEEDAAPDGAANDAAPLSALLVPKAKAMCCCMRPACAQGHSPDQVTARGRCAA